VARLTEWGYPARIVDAAEAAGLEPSLRLPGPACDVAWFPAEGYVLTEPLTSELTGRAVRRGATVLTGEQGHVVGLDADGGTIRAVRTAAGRVIPADAVVCCAGRWTPEVTALAAAACPVPLVPWAAPGATAPGLVVLAGPVTPPGPVRVIHAPGVFLRPHAGGLVHLEAPDAAVDLHTRRPNCGAGRSGCCTGRSGSSAGWMMRVSPVIASACARCRRTASPSWAGCPVSAGCTWR